MRQLYLSVVVLLGAAAAAHGQGFGGGINILSRPDFAYLTRKLPPVISNLPGSTLKLEATATQSVPREVLDVLITRTRAEILKDRDRKIRFDDNNSDVNLRCRVTGWELVAQERNVQNGNKVERYLRIIGNVQATVEVFNGRTRIPLDSANLKNHYEEEFDMSTGASTNWLKNLGTGKKSATRLPTPQEQQSMLMDGLAKKIAQRVVPIEEEVVIAIPKGKKFDEIKKAAQAKRWGEVVEMAEKMEPFPKPDDDAYRQYIIGVGHEVLAYQPGKGAKEIQDELSTAQSAYLKAKEMKREEKKFQDPNLRVQESIDHVIAILDVMKQSTVRDVEKPKGPPRTFSNDYLIYLHNDLKRSEKFIINQIETAADPKLDDSPAGQDALFRGGLSEDVVMAVSRRMAAVRSGNKAALPPSAAPATTPPPPAPAAAPQKTEGAADGNQAAAGTTATKTNATGTTQKTSTTTTKKGTSLIPSLPKVPLKKP